MTVYNTYTKSLKAGKEPDVYEYDVFPALLKNQTYAILKAVISDCLNKKTDTAWANPFRDILDALSDELYTFNIPSDKDVSFALLPNFLKKAKTNEWLDVISIVFYITEKYSKYPYDKALLFTRGYYPLRQGIEYLNIRFQEASFGYRYENGKIMRIDSTFTHEEIVKPALQLLNANPDYKRALDEFLEAHEHYRNKKYKACIWSCGTAFESILVAIHNKRCWPVPKGTKGAQILVNSCVTKNLIPSYLQFQYETLINILISGVPTIRNNDGGHGGEIKPEPPEQLASYCLHLTASNLLFLAKCNQEYEQNNI